MTAHDSDSDPSEFQIPETACNEAAAVSGPRIPQRIGSNHIKRVIASGGMRTVYEATQADLGRLVAVKVMKQGIASRAALRRFECEAQILARLRHPGIAQIYEAGAAPARSLEDTGKELPGRSRSDRRPVTPPNRKKATRN